MGMVDSQSRSSSNRANMNGTDDEKEKEAYWFPPAEATLKRTLIHKLISVLLKNRPPKVSSVACSDEGGPLFLLTVECPTIRLRFELCHTKSLTQSTPAMVLD